MSDNIVFHNIKEPPFTIHGLYKPLEGDLFRRMPQDVARASSDTVYTLHTNTSGGRIRFKSDADSVSIRVKMPPVKRHPHMTDAALFGFDLYIDRDGAEVYTGTFQPPEGTVDGYEATVWIGSGPEKQITVYFPLYSDISDVWIGLPEGASLGEHSPYRISDPILYYGSSITQGTAASRPGLTYEAWISRRIGADFINLGFAGGCRGEDTIADYIASTDPSVFVCDFDHNVYSGDELSSALPKLIGKFRESHPQTPIIMISKPDYNNRVDHMTDTRIVVFETYTERYRGGDRNIYYIDGSSLFAGYGCEDCTVDRCHPNDLGFFRMADRICPVIENALRTSKCFFRP